jgi:hypothetical protein
MFLVVAGVVLAAIGGTGQTMAGMPLWKFLLSLGIGAWILYNIPNILRQFG